MAKVGLCDNVGAYSSKSDAVADEDEYGSHHFVLYQDCRAVFKNREKIQRMFTVNLLLDRWKSNGTEELSIVVMGDVWDRANAKIYIMALVGYPEMVEKTVYLPSAVTGRDIESIERRSSAAVVRCDNTNVCSVRGTNLTVTAAMSMLEELVTNTEEFDLPLTPEKAVKQKRNKASRRLSNALQETLSKRNERGGNYDNVSDAVKRAIAGLIMDDEKESKQLDETRKDMAEVDVILIDDDSGDESNTMPILSEEGDEDDLMIIETPGKSDTEGNHFFGEQFKSPDENEVDDLTDALRNMRTPSKLLPDYYQTKPHAAVRPLSFTRNEAKSDAVKKTNGLESKKKDEDDAMKRGEIELSKSHSVNNEEISKSGERTCAKHVKDKYSNSNRGEVSSETSEAVKNDSDKCITKGSGNSKKKKKKKLSLVSSETGEICEDTNRDIEVIIINDTPEATRNNNTSQFENASYSASKRKKKKKKKRSLSNIIVGEKEDDCTNQVEVILIEDDIPAVVRKGKMFIDESEEQESKRRKLKSKVVKLNDDKTGCTSAERNISGEEEQTSTDVCEVFDKDSATCNRTVDESVIKSKGIAKEDTDRDLKSVKRTTHIDKSVVGGMVTNKCTEVDRNSSSAAAKLRTSNDKADNNRANSRRAVDEDDSQSDKRIDTHKDRVLVHSRNTVEEGGGRYIATQSYTEVENVNRNLYLSSNFTSRTNDLRYIVIDASNVAMSHGKHHSDKKIFSCKGIRICVNYFLRRGHKLITAFLPHWRKCRPNDPSTITDRHELDKLEQEGFLAYTPSRRIGNKLVAAYDDRYVLELADREDGIVVSNDQYRDLLREKSSWRRVIETRLLQYTFVHDHFMPPDDPMGKYGPTLSEFLTHPKPTRTQTYRTYEHMALKSLRDTGNGINIYQTGEEEFVEYYKR